MATVHDVAAYILRARGPMTAMKLQKLVYYAQACSLALNNRPLFDANIEAWSNGPVCVELYKKHRGAYEVSVWRSGDVTALAPEEEDAINMSLARFADLSAAALSRLTHAEQPWLEARDGLLPSERGNNEITVRSMREFYTKSQLGLNEIGQVSEMSNFIIDYANNESEDCWLDFAVLLQKDRKYGLNRAPDEQKEATPAGSEGDLQWE